MEKLSETMHEIEYGLDNALASLTVIFDPDRYSSIFSAYEMLNRTTVSIYLYIIMKEKGKFCDL